MPARTTIGWDHTLTGPPEARACHSEHRGSRLRPRLGQGQTDPHNRARTNAATWSTILTVAARRPSGRARPAHGPPRPGRPSPPGPSRPQPARRRSSAAVPNGSLAPWTTSGVRRDRRQLGDPRVARLARRVQRERQRHDPPGRRGDSRGRRRGPRHCDLRRTTAARRARPTVIATASRQARSRVAGEPASLRPAIRQGCSNRTTAIPRAGSSRASPARSAVSTPAPAPWPSSRTARGASPASSHSRPGPVSVGASRVRSARGGPASSSPTPVVWPIGTRCVMPCWGGEHPDDEPPTGLPQPHHARVRPRRRLHPPDHPRRPPRQRGRRPRAGAGVRGRGGQRWWCSPSSRLTGYSIEDLLMQDAVLEATERGPAQPGRRDDRPAPGPGRGALRCAACTASTTARS